MEETSGWEQFAVAAVEAGRNGVRQSLTYEEWCAATGMSLRRREPQDGELK